jgi:asparagine synthase (glutamine-hydrolysing)
MGFGVPIGQWLQGDLKEYLKEHLLSASFSKSDIIRYDVAEKLIADHISLKRNNATQLWTLLMLELWFRQFID